ncbi:MAG TPA: hypothetical protein VKC60_08650, partial [Opitutaceae bacterium]|nr:hypothetical protein [Opitutaceae bacterium]
EFFQTRVELDIRALAGGGKNPIAETRDRLDRSELLALALAKVNGDDNLIDETIKARDDMLLGNGAAPFKKLPKSTCFEVHAVTGFLGKLC